MLHPMKIGPRSVESTREEPGCAAEAAVSTAPPARDGAVRAMWMIAIASILTLNLLLPRSFLIFGVDPVSFLPVAFQIAWAGLAMGAVVCVPLVARCRIPQRVPWVLGTVAAASFFLFRTTLPGIHGNGESGGYPALGSARISLYPGADGRLPSFLNAGLARLLPDSFRFRYQFNALFQDFPLNASWILLTLLCGAALVLLATALTSRWRTTTHACRVGLLAVILSSPPMLNAYGHFDSYIVPVLCIGVWVGSLSFASIHPRRVPGWAGIALSLAAGAWAHPILLLLGAYTALLLALLLLGKTGRRIPWWVAVALGMGAGLMPYAVGRGNMDFFRPENRALLPWLLHEKAMSCISVSLPALLLGAAAAWTRRDSLRRLLPFQALAVVIALSSGLLFFSLWVGYGLRDEFLYSMLGAICLGGVVLLLVTTRPDARTLLAAAVFSVFLFAPKVWVYSGPLLHARFSRHMLHDRCSAARTFSAYYIVAAATPVDSPDYRELKLATLAEGFRCPVAEWSQPHYRLMSRAHYTAWCLEFGKDRDATRQLEWFLLNSPDVLPRLWQGNGRAFRTDYFLNRSPERARKLSRDLLIKHRSRPGGERFGALWAALESAERTDPVKRYTPRPGTTESDIKERMGEFWNAHAPP